MADISDVEMKERTDKLKEIDDFLIDVENRVKYIVGELNWDYEKLCQEKVDMVTCSINPQHRMPKSSIKAHEEKCKWLRDGYSEDDQPFPEYSNNGSCVTITPELQTQIIGIAASKTDNFQLGNINAERPVPQTAKKLEQDFTRDERLAIYDYVIANTQKTDTITDFTFLSPEEKREKKTMSDWEIAAAERDAKRRRASYRNKVHTNKKTHTEIMREVIESQMECLIETTAHQPEVEIPTVRTSKKHDDQSSYKNSKKHDNGYKDSHHHKKGHHESRKERHRSRSREHTRHKKSHKKDRSSSRSKHKKKKHKRSVSRSRSREKYRKYSSKTT